MNPIRKTIDLIEAKSKTELKLNPLPYDRDGLKPVLSQQSMDYHYGRLAQGYVDRYNKGEGDPTFNEAGAYLHNLYFGQLKPVGGGVRPTGTSLTLVNDIYGSFDDFKHEIEAAAMAIQGSGWVYMARNGRIKTIANHAIRRDIALLIDWWEHSWFTDYGPNKKKYLKNIWRIIDWDVVNMRLTT